MSGDALEREAREWIEAIIGQTLEGTFAEALKDGAALCRLAIIIYAKAGRPLVLKINEPATFKPLTMASKKMENITNALKAIRALGMKEFEMFSTLDLYEEKNLQAVVRCIHALGRLMQSAAFASLDLPRLGVKVVEKHERTFTAEQLAQAQNAVGLLSLGSSSMAQKASAEVLSGRAATHQKGAPPSDAAGPPSKAAAASAAAAKATSPARAAAAAAGGGGGSEAAAAAAAAASAYVPAAGASSAPAATAAAPAPAAATATAALPDDWEELTTEAGDAYYYSASRGVTSWDRPGVPGSAAAGGEAALPAGWTELLTPDGQAYFFHEARGTTQWERPSS